jgi:hypothetical protein
MMSVGSLSKHRVIILGQGFDTGSERRTVNLADWELEIRKAVRLLDNSAQFPFGCIIFMAFWNSFIREVFIWLKFLYPILAKTSHLSSD